MAVHRSLRNKSAGFVNCFLYAIGDVQVIFGDVRPDIEDVSFGELSESVRGLFLGRHSDDRHLDDCEDDRDWDERF